jgi:hypothetical protein
MYVVKLIGFTKLYSHLRMIGFDVSFCHCICHFDLYEEISFFILKRGTDIILDILGGSTEADLGEMSRSPPFYFRQYPKRCWAQALSSG